MKFWINTQCTNICMYILLLLFLFLLLLYFLLLLLYIVNLHPVSAKYLSDNTSRTPDSDN